MFRLQFVSTRYARTQTRPSVSTPQNEKNRRKAPEKQHINTQQTTKKTSKHKKTRVIQTSLYTFTCNGEGRSDEMKRLSDFFNVPMHVFIELDTEKREHPSNSELSVVPFVFHKWVRDPFLLTDSQVIVPPSLKYWRGGQLDRRQVNALGDQIKSALEVIAMKEGLQAAFSPFYFEGGQVLKDDQHVFLPEYMDDSRNFLHPPSTQNGLNNNSFQTVYDSLLGNTLFVPVLASDGRMAVGGHLDTLLMPAAPGKVIMADYELGAQIAREMDPTQKEIFERKVQAYTKTPGLRLAKDQKQDPRIDEVARKVAQTLALKYEIISVPFPVFVDPTTPGGENTVFLDYANSLLDLASKKAAIPVYGVEAFDEATVAAYNRAGYSNILRVDSLKTVGDRAGVHCLYLEVRERTARINL